MLTPESITPNPYIGLLLFLTLGGLSILFVSFWLRVPEEMKRGREGVCGGAKGGVSIRPCECTRDTHESEDGGCCYVGDTMYAVAVDAYVCVACLMVCVGKDGAGRGCGLEEVGAPI